MTDPQTTNPPEDIIFALACERGKPSPEGSLMFAAKASGIFRSADGGKNWDLAFHLEDMQEPLPALSICLSPDFGHDHNVFVGVPGGVLRSFDRGETWRVEKLGSPPPVTGALVISPNFADDGILLAGTNEDGIFRSLDRGLHWSTCNFNLLDLNVLSLAISPDFASDEMLFAGTVSGLFRSKNGGRAWREVDFPFGYDPVLSLAFAPDFATSKLLLAGTETQGLQISRNAGATWERIGQDILVHPINAILHLQDVQGKETVFILNGDQVFYSDDGLQAWQEWEPAAKLNEGISAIALPGWHTEGKPQLLAGLADGRVLVLG
jgi:photosystem II stability/assembly factor-like uncharacterized protein